MPSQEAVELLLQMRDSLASIDASLKVLVAQKRAESPKPVASDRDLDGKYGDPVVKFMPRDWTGPTFKGRRFSECPADLLDMFANTFDWFADQAERTNERTDRGKPVADFKRADAARARGWAKRIREGRHVRPAGATPPPSSNWGEEEESGFGAELPGGF
jgi:hypothetical protein